MSSKKFPLISLFVSAYCRYALHLSVLCTPMAMFFLSIMQRVCAVEEWTESDGVGLCWITVASAIAFCRNAHSMDSFWPGNPFTLSQVIKGSQRTSQKLDGEGLNGKISLLDKCGEKARRCFFFCFLPMKSIHSMVECLNHVQKYLAEQSGTALMVGLVGACIPVIVTSILQ